jgi:hypothetical protein
MPEYLSIREMTSAVRQHVFDTRHEVLQDDDLRFQTIGYTCADCDEVREGWYVPLAALRVDTDPIAHQFRSTILRSAAARDQFLAYLNEGAENRFFEGRGTDVTGSLESYQDDAVPEEIRALSRLFDTSTVEARAKHEKEWLAGQTRQAEEQKRQAEEQRRRAIPTRFDRDPFEE